MTTVLSAGGNLRALTVLIVVAIVAHATLKGVLAPLRIALAEPRVSLGDYASLSALPGGALVWTGVLGALALAVISRSGARPGMLVLAAVIGLLVPLGWVGTGWVLFDDFDPIAFESLSFTGPAADTLFWTLASTAIAPNFGVGLIGGVVAGAFVAALLTSRFVWQSFANPRETGRYLSGAVLMGIGGVLAGGCTVGAGLSGVSSLSVAALLALGSIAVGALVTHRALNRAPAPGSRQGAGSAGSQPKPGLQPAE